MTANEYMKKIKDNLDSVEQNLEQIQCDDCISRQALIDKVKKYASMLWEKYMEPFPESTIMEIIQALPPVTQQPKIGHWIEKDGFDGDVYYDCSECGESWTTIEGTPWQNGMKYCPNCGCRMVDPQESE